MFCGKKRKVKVGKEEPLFRLSTKDGLEALKARTAHSTNGHRHGLVLSGVDLTAMEAEYHRSCRRKFDYETETKAETSAEAPSRRHYHQLASTAIATYVETEVIEKQKSIMASDLMEIYRAQLVEAGGNLEDVKNYPTQKLVEKMKKIHGSSLQSSLLDQRKGLFLHNSSVDSEQARLELNDNVEDAKRIEVLRSAALVLRAAIQQLPKSKTPTPASIESLKESAPKIPEALELFFSTLMCGATPHLLPMKMCDVRCRRWHWTPSLMSVAGPLNPGRMSPWDWDSRL